MGIEVTSRIKSQGDDQAGTAGTSESRANKANANQVLPSDRTAMGIEVTAETKSQADVKSATCAESENGAIKAAQGASVGARGWAHASPRRTATGGFWPGRGTENCEWSETETR